MTAGHVYHVDHAMFLPARRSVTCLGASRTGGENSGLKPVHGAMDRDEAGDANRQKNRGCHESQAKPAPRIEPPVTPESHDDVSGQIGGLPSSEPTPDFRYHGHFQQATAGSTYKTARRE
jgi:hypothetical protein